MGPFRGFFIVEIKLRHKMHSPAPMCLGLESCVVGVAHEVTFFMSSEIFHSHFSCSCVTEKASVMMCATSAL